MRTIGRIFGVLVLLVASLETYQLATESTSFTSALAHLLFSNNLHEVVPEKLYRSGEMRVKELVPEAKRLRVRTVLDVRMDPADVSEPYQGEGAALNAAGVNYVSFPMMGSKEMSKEQVEQLLAVLDGIEPPLLVHCSSGTHRSGVVAAIYLMEKEGMPYERAIEQLSSRYGFFRAERQLKSVFSGRPTIDNLLWRYGEFRKGEPTVTFREWVQRGMP